MGSLSYNVLPDGIGFLKNSFKTSMFVNFPLWYLIPAHSS